MNPSTAPAARILPRLDQLRIWPRRDCPVSQWIHFELVECCRRANARRASAWEAQPSAVSHSTLTRPSPVEGEGTRGAALFGRDAAFVPWDIHQRRHSQPGGSSTRHVRKDTRPATAPGQLAPRGLLSLNGEGRGEGGQRKTRKKIPLRLGFHERKGNSVVRPESAGGQGRVGNPSVRKDGVKRSRGPPSGVLVRPRIQRGRWPRHVVRVPRRARSSARCTQ